MTQCRVIGIEGPNGEPLNYILFSVYREDIRELRKEKEQLKKEKGEIRQRLVKLEKAQAELSRVKENKKLEQENKKLKSEIENMKKVGRENIETLDKMSIELENYSESFKRYRDFSKQELADSLYDAEEQNKKLKEEIDNGFNRETDLRNRRADSLLENKDLRDKIEELEKEIEELNKMMLFETELEK